MAATTEKIYDGGETSSGIAKSSDDENLTPTQEATGESSKNNYLSGSKLHFMTFGLCLSLYLVNVEVTIISTSLVAITNSLNGFNKSSWILTSYLLTYTGFIIIWAKASDIIGRKTCNIVTLTLFTIFSGACGAAQTMTQLIMFRAFQGVGAAGGFALTILIIHEMVPPNKYPTYGALMAADMALATLSGPLFGGVISDKSTWRWVFLMNVPAGVIAIIILALAIPTGFPHHSLSSTTMLKGKAQKLKFGDVAKRLDLSGAVLLLAASLLLTTALLEGGVEWAWSSATSISLLTVSGVLWICFFAWERTVTSEKWSQEPVFPWRFLFNRIWMGVLLTSFLNGFPFYVLVVSIPQRFQTVDHLSPVQTGIRMLPYTLIASIGAIIANLVVAKGRIPVIYVAAVFSILTAIGTGLLITIPTSEDLPKAVYGYQTLAGLGLGATFALVILMVPFVVEARDLATANGALIEFRILGGAIGLAVVASAMENYLRSHLAKIVSPDQLHALLRSTSVLHELPPPLRAKAMQIFAEGFALQMKITTAFAALQLVAIGMMWKTKQITIGAKV